MQGVQGENHTVQVQYIKQVHDRIDFIAGLVLKPAGMKRLLTFAAEQADQADKVLLAGLTVTDRRTNAFTIDTDPFPFFYSHISTGPSVESILQADEVKAFDKSSDTHMGRHFTVFETKDFDRMRTVQLTKTADLPVTILTPEHTHNDYQQQRDMAITLTLKAARVFHQI